jgi:hypothetical protein
MPSAKEVRERHKLAMAGYDRAARCLLITEALEDEEPRWLSIESGKVVEVVDGSGWGAQGTRLVIAMPGSVEYGAIRDLLGRIFGMNWDGNAEDALEGDDGST